MHFDFEHENFARLCKNIRNRIQNIRETPSKKIINLIIRNWIALMMVLSLFLVSWITLFFEGTPSAKKRHLAPSMAIWNDEPPWKKIQDHRGNIYILIHYNYQFPGGKNRTSECLFENFFGNYPFVFRIRLLQNRKRNFLYNSDFSSDRKILQIPLPN